jgi:hypothetical protein
MKNNIVRRIFLAGIRSSETRRRRGSQEHTLNISNHNSAENGFLKPHPSVGGGFVICNSESKPIIL